MIQIIGKRWALEEKISESQTSLEAGELVPSAEEALQDRLVSITEEMEKEYGISFEIMYEIKPIKLKNGVQLIY